MTKMCLSYGIVHAFFILLIYTRVELQAASCEEAETELAKIDVIKDCITKSKTFYPDCKAENENRTDCGNKSKAFAQLNIALDLLERSDGRKEACPECPEPEVVYGDRPVDCSEIFRMGHKKSGVYEIWPRSRSVVNKSISVYCDMDRAGGGWTVIQRRNNYTDQTNFYQDWNTYKKGFGILEKDFWLGNDNIFTLTNQGVYSLRFDLVNHLGEYRYAVYDSFYIGDESSSYRMHVNKFSGTLSNDFQQHNDQMFSTRDRQRDGRGRDNACAVNYRGAWWYHGTCGHVNLNGMYLPGVNDVKSMFWFDWKRAYGLFSSEMKIRHRYPNLSVPKLNSVQTQKH